MNLVFVLIPLLCVGLWTASLWGADPRQMRSLGLLDLLTPASYVALGLLILSFLAALYRERSDAILWLHLIGYVGIIHATAPILYGTVRYAWSYKHVGIVDYIIRHSGVNPQIAIGEIYHNWPGFFAGSAFLTELAGTQNALIFASWSPFFFNLLNLLMIRFVFRRLTINRAQIWLGMLFFLLINWVGQDYFSPQALCFVLYIGLLGIMLYSTVQRRMIWPFTIVAAAIAVSHQITPLMMVIAVAGLVVLRRVRGWYLPLIAVGLTAAWALTGGLDYTLPNAEDLVSEMGNVINNTEQTLDKSSGLSGAASMQVVWGGRITVAISVLVALLGIWRHRRTGKTFITAALLMILPGVLVVTTGFGGEVLFRAFLFATPFIAYLAAGVCLPRKGSRLTLKRTAAAGTIALLVLPGFLLGYFGKESENYFTNNEVAASEWVYTHAADDSLLAEGSSNYPGRFVDYEKFTYVPLSREPEDSIQEFVDDPVAKLASWFNSPRYKEGYFLVTRSQEVAAERDGSLPPGSLEQIVNKLRASDQFRIVYENPDAVVFALAQGQGS